MTSRHFCRPSARLKANMKGCLAEAEASQCPSGLNKRGIYSEACVGRFVFVASVLVGV